MPDSNGHWAPVWMPSQVNGPEEHFDWTKLCLALCLLLCFYAFFAMQSYIYYINSYLFCNSYSNRWLSCAIHLGIFPKTANEASTLLKRTDAKISHPKIYMRSNTVCGSSRWRGKAILRKSGQEQKQANTCEGKEPKDQQGGWNTVVKSEQKSILHEKVAHNGRQHLSGDNA